ncbi:thyroid stimulating hormone subunit beta a isoform X2 [Tachysurus fulvidraco]|uniref:thyroid stimulating hormone subunit beta a isoform X2 n=1 Tax=Tachysurus fulvidraco TaxID=1234273 RepID=UPI001FED947C|nr:thyroid stimulating hormone subunit beta a isoform X2 [Tachysurus fulvidraco]
MRVLVIRRQRYNFSLNVYMKCVICMILLNPGSTTFCVFYFLFLSQDSNMKELVGHRFLFQRSCTYQDMEYRTTVLPGCALHADSYFTYPIALSCHCSMCNTHSEECAHKTRFSSAKCSKPVRHLYPSPREIDYI